MPEVKWLPQALDDIERLYNFLKDKNPTAASKAARCILEGANLLKNHIQIGRPMSDGSGRRELFLPFATGSYVLRYMAEGDDIAVIIRVWHNKENKSAP